jgi:8-oxo-dGTP diphosphatase
VTAGLNEMELAPARIHVAAAAIFDEQGRVLISRRPLHVHQGGLWEFPGGKLEPGESVANALRRELHEELGIIVQAARPLIRVVHDYADKAVLLDVWRVDAFTGTAAGNEGQVIEWAAVGALGEYRFPAANTPIIKAVSLPDRYLVTPEPGSDHSSFLRALEGALGRGVSLVQLRAKRLSAADFRTLVPAVQQLCRQADARLLLNAEAALVSELGADGVHLTSARLRGLSARPLGDEYLVGASCHTRQEVQHAGALGLDFIVVSPVQQTASHPDARLLGFDGLQQLTEQASLPVYALGGMQLADLATAFRHGAQGIAAINGLWGDPVV